MPKRLYVENLPDSVGGDDLLALFSQAGSVELAEILEEEGTGLPSGLGYVDMETEAGAAEALRKFDGYVLEEQPMRVRLPAATDVGAPPSEGGSTSAG